jgi:hypothetical protein
MIEITYVHTRVRTTDYIYDVELDGEWIAAACNYSAAEKAAQDVEARQHLLALIEDEVRQARQQAEQAQAEQLTVGDYLMFVDDNDCIPSGTLDTMRRAIEAQDEQQAQAKQGNLQAQIDQGWDYAECPCGAQALYFVQYADRVYAYCPECWQHREAFTLPLLGQCARLLDSLLGGPVANGGILDEVRRLRARLAQEGW